MNTKNIFKAVAMVMLMPAVLLTTSCGKGDDAVTNSEKPANTEAAINKGYALPVTVNVTRQGDGTRATYNESTKKLEFSTGDKLFVIGSASEAGQFAGTLDYVPATGNFSGTIYTKNPYSGTADALFTAASAGENLTATLLPNNYESTGFLSIYNNSTTDIAYDDRLTVSGSKAFVASETAKATGVEQLSWEQASTYSSGFALSPGNAILNFTITGLEAGAKEVSLQISEFAYTVFGSVTPNASGTATFAIGAVNGRDLKDCTLTVDGNAITLVSESKPLEAGKIYNITRTVAPSVPEGAINGKFTVASGKQVYFSKGNLQYDANAATKWYFAEHQYDYIGSATGYPMDLFTWGNIANPAYDGTDYYTGNSDLSGTYDWGSNIGEGWYTLSKDEWVYLFQTRTNAASKYGYATVADKYGIIILPDEFTDPNNNGGSGAFVGSSTTSWSANIYSAENWSYMESAGAVFLPAAGYRSGDSVYDAGTYSYYWSSTAFDENIAYDVNFNSDGLNAHDGDGRCCGHSVRLVRDVK